MHDAECHTLVTNVFATGVAVVGFLIDLLPNELEDYDRLIIKLQHICLIMLKDKVSWVLEASGKFSVKFLYAKLAQGPKVRYAKAPWAAGLLPRVRILLLQATLDHLSSAF